MSETVPLQKRKRIPEWLRLKLPRNSAFTQTRGLLEELDLLHPKSRCIDSFVQFFHPNSLIRLLNQFFVLDNFGFQSTEH